MSREDDAQTVARAQKLADILLGASRDVSIRELKEETGFERQHIRRVLDSFQVAGLVERFDEPGGTAGRPKVTYRVIVEKSETLLEAATDGGAASDLLFGHYAEPAVEAAPQETEQGPNTIEVLLAVMMRVESKVEALEAKAQAPEVQDPLSAKFDALAAEVRKVLEVSEAQRELSEKAAARFNDLHNALGPMTEAIILLHQSNKAQLGELKEGLLPILKDLEESLKSMKKAFDRQHADAHTLNKNMSTLNTSFNGLSDNLDAVMPAVLQVAGETGVVRKRQHSAMALISAVAPPPQKKEP